MELHSLFLFFIPLLIADSVALTVKPINSITCAVFSIENRQDESQLPELFSILIDLVSPCGDETPTIANSGFQIFYDDHNSTDLIMIADVENVTAAMVLLSSAAEYFQNRFDSMSTADLSANCSGSTVCKVISDWLVSASNSITPLTRFNFLLFADRINCPNNDLFEKVTALNHVFPDLQKSYSYFVGTQPNCNDSSTFVTVDGRNITATVPSECVAEPILDYDLSMEKSAVNVFFRIDISHLDEAISFVVDHLMKTDNCAWNDNTLTRDESIQWIYYLKFYVNNSGSYESWETVIPWVEFTSVEEFENYTVESIHFMSHKSEEIDNVTGMIETPLKKIFDFDLVANYSQYNILYTDSPPDWLTFFSSKTMRTLDIILVMDGGDYDERTVKYHFYKDQGFNDSKPVNFYVFNSTDFAKDVFTCRQSTEAVLFKYDHIKSNYWFFWFIGYGVLLFVGLCVARFMILKNANKNKSELKGFIDSHKLLPQEAAVLVQSRDQLYLETEFLVIDYDKILGRGSSSTVYEALIKGDAPILRTTKALDMTKYHDCSVAAKVPKNQFGRDQIEGLISEIDAGRLLGYHPNICVLLGWTMHQGSPCLFFEPMKQNLLTFAVGLNAINDDEKIEFPQMQMTQIFLQIANALSYVSSIGLIHRDVAARNILLQAGNFAKLADFGLACRADATTSLYKQWTSVNKKLPIKWLALESIIDRTFSEKTDVWSFGIAIMEAFTYGSEPYPDIGTGEIVAHLKAGRRMEKCDNLDDDLYELVKRCWLENPAERPTFEELRTQLGSVLEKYNSGYYVPIADETGSSLEGSEIVDELKDAHL